MSSTFIFDKLPVLVFKWYAIGVIVCAIIQIGKWIYYIHTRPHYYVRSQYAKDILISSLISSWMGVLIYASDLVAFLNDRYVRRFFDDHNPYKDTEESNRL